jgi:Trk-type K+ transport system membrane component
MLSATRPRLGDRRFRDSERPAISISNAASTVASILGNFLPVNSIAIEIITMVLMLLGATNFVLHTFLLTAHWKEFFKDIEIRFAIIMVLVLHLGLHRLESLPLSNAAGTAATGSISGPRSVTTFSMSSPLSRRPVSRISLRFPKLGEVAVLAASF